MKIFNDKVFVIVIRERIVLSAPRFSRRFPRVSLFDFRNDVSSSIDGRVIVRYVYISTKLFAVIVRQIETEKGEGEKWARLYPSLYSIEPSECLDGNKAFLSVLHRARDAQSAGWISDSAFINTRGVAFSHSRLRPRRWDINPFFFESSEVRGACPVKRCIRRYARHWS